MFAFVNLARLEWDTGYKSVNFSNLCSIFSAIAVIALPILLMWHTIKSIRRWSDEEYVAKYGTNLEGLRLDLTERKWIVVFIPIIHFLRRFLTAVSLVAGSGFFWVQLAI